jgi:hypothetical protein
VARVPTEGVEETEDEGAAAPAGEVVAAADEQPPEVPEEPREAPKEASAVPDEKDPGRLRLEEWGAAVGGPPEGVRPASLAELDAQLEEGVLTVRNAAAAQKAVLYNTAVRLDGDFDITLELHSFEMVGVMDPHRRQVPASVLLRGLVPPREGRSWHEVRLTRRDGTLRCRVDGEEVNRLRVRGDAGVSGYLWLALPREGSCGLRRCRIQAEAGAADAEEPDREPRPEGRRVPRLPRRPRPDGEEEGGRPPRFPRLRR